MKIAIIGAGAAGCFCAIQIKRNAASAEVDVYESGTKALAKVAITGGGRCNLTNSFRAVKSLKEAYPRGEQVVKRAFCEFDHEDTYRWFENEGVPLVTQDDECVFPRSQDAMQIVNTLLGDMKQAGVRLHTGCRVTSIVDERDNGVETDMPYTITMADGHKVKTNAVVVTTGGSPKQSGLDFLSTLGLRIEPPVPSLFSFNIKGMTDLMGTVVENVTCGIAGTKMRTRGALLVTHWGMSGPAVLKLSSHAARLLAECGYKARLLVNWMDEANENEVMEMLATMQHDQQGKQIGNTHPQQLTSRMWQYLLQRSEIRLEQRWAEVGRKQMNRLASVLTADVYDIEGQSRHKDEFVTCGGISIKNINPSSLECRQHPGLFFAGEVLDVDAITGGFNLQAAWSMGYVVAMRVNG